MQKRKIPWLIYGVIGIFVAYLGYLTADAYMRAENILQVYQLFQENLKNPFANYWNEYSINGILIFFVIYAFFIFFKEVGRKNYMPGREYGSSKFGDPKEINKVLADHNEKRPENIRVVKR